MPVLHQGMFDTSSVVAACRELRERGSRIVPGYMNPEGVVIYHCQSGTSFKVTLDGDEAKGKAVAA